MRQGRGVLPAPPAFVTLVDFPQPALGPSKRDKVTRFNSERYVYQWAVTLQSVLTLTLFKSSLSLDL